MRPPATILPLFSGHPMATAYKLADFPPEVLSAITSYLGWDDQHSLLSTLNRVLWQKLVHHGGVTSVLLADSSRRAPSQHFLPVPLVPHVTLASSRQVGLHTPAQAVDITMPRVITRTPYKKLLSVCINTSTFVSLDLAALPPTLTSIELYLRFSDIVSLIKHGAANFSSKKSESPSSNPHDPRTANLPSLAPLPQHGNTKNNPTPRRFKHLFPLLRFLSLRAFPANMEPGGVSHPLDHLQWLVPSLPPTLEGFAHNLWPLDTVFGQLESFPPTLTALTSDYIQTPNEYSFDKPSKLLLGLTRLDMPFLQLFEPEDKVKIIGPKLQWLTVHQLSRSLLDSMPASLTRLGILEPEVRGHREPLDDSPLVPQIQCFEAHYWRHVLSWLPSPTLTLTHIKYRPKEQSRPYLTADVFTRWDLARAAPNLKLFDAATSVAVDTVLPHLPSSLTRLMISAIEVSGALYAGPRPEKWAKSESNLIEEVVGLITTLPCLITFDSPTHIVVSPAALFE